MVMIQVMVFTVKTLYSDITWYQHFGGPCCLHYASSSFKALVYHDMVS